MVNIFAKDDEIPTETFKFSFTEKQSSEMINKYNNEIQGHDEILVDSEKHVVNLREEISTVKYMKRNSDVSRLEALNFAINLHSSKYNKISIEFLDTVEDDFTLVNRKKGHKC